MLKNITSHRLSSVQASTSRSVTGTVQRYLIGCNCDSATVEPKRDGCHMGHQDAIRMGPGETVDIWDQYMGRADWTHAICNLTRSSCTAGRSHGVRSKRKKLTLNIFHFSTSYYLCTSATTNTTYNNIYVLVVDYRALSAASSIVA